MSIERIAIISGKDPQIPQDTDGANILVRNLAHHYAASGTEVAIFTPVGYSGHQAMANKADEQLQKVADLEPGVHVTRFPVPKLVTPRAQTPGLDFMNRVAISMAEAGAFADGVLEEFSRVHIIHMAHAFGLVLGNITPGERTVLHPMMLGREYERYMPVTPSYIDFEREVFMRRLLAQVPSEDEAKTLKQDYDVEEKNIVVTPRGFDHERLIPKLRQRPTSGAPIKILCANMIRPQKGQDVFVPFAKECKKRRIPIKIHLIGVNGNSYSPAYNEYARKLRKDIEDAGLEDSFEFLEPMDHEDLNDHMQNSDFAIYPSQFETFGKAPLESMATGLPTLVFDDVHAFQEFIKNEETGLCVARAPHALVDALERCLKEDGLYEKLSQQGIEAGENFHWEVVLKRMLKDINDHQKAHALPA